MRILFVVGLCNIFKIDSGGALRNTLFAQALSEIGHVDVVCTSYNDVISNIPNCDVIFSKEIADYYGPMDSVRTLAGTIFRPLSPYSYYKVIKGLETCREFALGKIVDRWELLFDEIRNSGKAKER